MIDSVAGAPASPMPGAHQQQRDARAGRSRCPCVIVAAIASPAGEQQHPRGHDALGAEPRDELRGQRRAHDHRPGVGQHAHAGRRRRVAEHELQVLRRQEQEPEEGEEQHHDRGARRGEARVRGTGARRAAARRRAAATRRTRPARRRRSAPAASTGADVQPFDGASMTAHTSATRPAPDSAAPVQSMRRATGSRDSGTSSRARRRPRSRDQRHVDEEDRSPPEVVEQQAADDRAERDAEARGRGPDADRHRALARVGEDADQQRQRRRHDERGAGAHHRAREDELVDAARVRGRTPRRRRTPPARRAACAGARSGPRARRRAAAGPRTRACTRRPPTAARSRPRRGRAPASAARR